MATEEVEQLAKSCNSLDELARTLDAFDACPLKRTATQLCFADGLPGAHVMIIGEAPGRDEDEQGRPFVGKSGQLLDKMLACIGLNRASDDPAQSVFISNIVFWRPPGNRKPSTSEVVMCLPFVRRAIELAKPRIVIAAGATPAQALLDTPTGITRMRGTWKTIATGTGEVDVMPTLHPSYLLRSPEAKRFAWRDLLAVKAKLLAM
jgi:DNA polymerase